MSLTYAVVFVAIGQQGFGGIYWHFSCEKFLAELEQN
jgi:hypothetical protein